MFLRLAYVSCLNIRPFCLVFILGQVGLTQLCHYCSVAAIGLSSGHPNIVLRLVCDS